MSFAISLMGEICAKWGVTREEIRGYTKNKRINAARREFTQRARRHGLTFPVIGRLLARDHSTAIHNARIAEKMDEQGIVVAPIKLIPVSVSLPEDRMPVLLFLNIRGKKGFRSLWIKGLRRDGVWFGSGPLDNPSISVTHWAEVPLP